LPAVAGAKWPHRELRWRLKEKELNEVDIFTKRGVLPRRFDIWAMASTNLPFGEIRPRDSRALDIEISFEKRDHGDELPFDGPGTGSC